MYRKLDQCKITSTSLKVLYTLTNVTDWNAAHRNNDKGRICACNQVLQAGKLVRVGRLGVLHIMFCDSVKKNSHG